MRTVLITLCCTFLLASARAESRRDFAGRYAFANVTESGGVVHVSLTIQVINHSGREVSAARLYLQGGVHAAGSLLTAGLTVPEDAYRTVHAEVVVSAGEYERWRQGGRPSLEIEVAGARGGGITRRTVELLDTPLLPELQ